MAKNNSNLHGAKKAKNDEFYTQLSDIEKECVHYRPHFKDKVVFCNCNDALHSNFAKYFSLNFEFLGLKKLICTTYKVDGVHGKVCIYEGDKNGNRVPDLDEWECHMLDGDGGFASEECIEFLKESDIVVTNPPFSLFREYVALLMKYEKKFLIIGNNNAISYKDFFHYIKDGKVWLGRTLFTGKMPFFRVSSDYNLTNSRFEKREDGLYKQVNGVCWFTNLSNDDKRETLVLYKKYNKDEHPSYDNYDAINVDKVTDMPIDFDGVIGMPITGLKYLWSDGKIHAEINGKDTQFEIIGITENADYLKPLYIDGNDKYDRGYIKGKRMYSRLLIKRVF